MDAPPKFTFAFGLVLGIAIFAVIGFFTVISGKVTTTGSADTKGTTSGTVAAANTNSIVDVTEPDAPTAIDASALTITDEDHVRGEGDITLVEFSDFECPFCGTLHPTMQKVLETYKGKVKQVYKHYPLSFHPNALPAANASECAAEQGKFWEMHDKLFENQDTLSATAYKTYAEAIGLDTAKFQKCFDANTYSSKISAQQALGNKVGVQGTPATVLIDKDGNAQMISGALPYESFVSAIDAVLN